MRSSSAAASGLQLGLAGAEEHLGLEHEAVADDADVRAVAEDLAQAAEEVRAVARELLHPLGQRHVEARSRDRRCAPGSRCRASRRRRAPPRARRAGGASRRSAGSGARPGSAPGRSPASRLRAPRRAAPACAVRAAGRASSMPCRRAALAPRPARSVDCRAVERSPRRSRRSSAPAPGGRSARRSGG